MGPKNDGTVQGGTGTWRLGGGSSDWTSAAGTANSDYQQDAFAVFSGAPGTVTVDDVGGLVGVSGMQFIVDGYVVGGDDLTLAGVQTDIRVGDGTAAGTAMTVTINSVLGGGGQLVKTDLGTLVLNGTNTYTGGTLIEDGVLQISSNANLGDSADGLEFDGGTLQTTANIISARSVTLTGAGRFLTEAATTLTLSGAIAGAGGLDKQGAGSMVLTGDATHTGGTTISAGTLQIGNGGTSGSLGGDVTNNSSLSVSRSDLLTLTGSISGTGELRQIGTGTTILTSDNTYSGGTTISAGTLQLGNGGTSGSILGDVVDNGTLAVSRSDIMTFNGVISGTGGVSQIGTGSTILTGANIYSGTTDVQAGSLIVDGDQSGATGPTTVNGGVLGGTGIIGGDVIVANGAAINPGELGNVPGVLTMRENLSLGSGSLLNYDFGQAGAVGGPFNDLIEVDGNVVLDGTIDVAVSPGGTFDPGIYRIMSYGGSLTDNGLQTGTIPSPDFFVQTTIAGQVNLINTAGLNVSFWDGALGPTERRAHRRRLGRVAELDRQRQLDDDRRGGQRAVPGWHLRHLYCSERNRHRRHQRWCRECLGDAVRRGRLCHRG